ncbi:hypothetical protein SUGI_0401520 [Cryptomeria japonica]|uniref:uncharacterized protein LOC131030516 n=1 Tax=Cryptomeria japonica TaxID=3369 RepID=UPI002408AD4F|nr:uncharacterized protein LOC131030516 [Cryptomeria japonica]GLJ21606.1 hypothetical protein SUGI_0401520 [Cryptomeria japonica]
MERVISPQLKQEPDGDRESRKPAIENYVQQLDKKAIVQFLARLSELQDGQASGQHSITWYEVMAREHGKLIIPHISDMMRNVVKVLSSDAPSLTLQQACAKVVSTLARYTIEPSSFERQTEGVIRDLARPLLEVLLGNAQSLAEGAAMCLHALVNTEAWKFAPDDIVNEVCLRVAGALEEKGTQTTGHMKLVCSLAKHNSLILEAYGRTLLKAADDILVTANWQLRLHAVQMINALLKSVDSDILASEIPITITHMERCRSDRIPSIRNAASETLKIAKAIASERGMDVNYESFSSEVEISNEDVTSQNSNCCSISDFSQDTRMDSYGDSPVSLCHSFNSKRQTPSILGPAAGARRSCSLHGSQDYNSDGIDEASFSGKIRASSFSMHPEMSNSKSKSPYTFLNHRGKYSESGGYFIGKSRLKDNSLPEGDTESEIDGGTSGRNYSRGDMKTRLCMLQRRENGDESTYEEDCIETKHFRLNYIHSPLPSEVGEEDTGRPKKTECMARTDDMKLNEFSPPGACVGSLQCHSSPLVTRRKSQSITEFTDFTDGNYDIYDSLRVVNTEQMPAALKGRTLLDKLESAADGFSDRSNSQEGSMQNSSVWSESVQISDSLSPTSSDNLFQDVLDNEEDYLTTIPTEPDKRTPRVDHMKENCQSAEVDSSEGSVDFPEFEEMSAFRRGWTKVVYLMESMLRGSLCAVLAIPVAMVAVKLFSVEEECHVMVPT